jgi:filamentous hemagglutinin
MAKLHGTGPAPGMVELSDRARSNRAFLQIFKDSDRPVEFVYDPATQTILVTQSRGGGTMARSPHQRLASHLPAGHGTIVGGEVGFGANGSVLTNELSGHFGTNWTPEIRQQRIAILGRLTGRAVVHSPFGRLPGGRN